jgi:CheY-like chemotaxis protein
MIHCSLRMKFATIITFLIAAISVFIYVYFPDKLEMQARKAIADKAATISEMMAFSISPSLLFRDKEAAEEAIQVTLQNEDLAYVMVIDHGGEVFASFNEQTAREANYWKAEIKDTVSAPGGYYRTVTPVSYNGRVIGQIYLGLSLESLEADIKASRTAVALVSSLIFLFGMAAVFLISSLINKPLARLVNIVDKIARGDLSQRVKVSSRDEIGQLAGSLNSMIATLESAYSRLGNLNRLLEHEVEVRTRELRHEITERRKAEEEARAALEYEFRSRGEQELVSSKGGNLVHVLLAEDNFVNRKLAVWMLNKLGCRVDLAVNGEEAVKMVKGSSYDLVLMDCQMPSMDGYEATALIRTAEGKKKKRLPIIAITASTTESDRKRCLKAGMDDHVTKPIRPGDLKTILERWTDIQIEQDVKGKRAKGKGQS